MEGSAVPAACVFGVTSNRKAYRRRCLPRLLSRTGEQFYCADKWSPSGRPLLEVMADPGTLPYWEELHIELTIIQTEYFGKP